MIDIRLNQKDYDALYPLFIKRFTNKEGGVYMHVDLELEQPIIMVKQANGEFVSWLIGYDKVKTFLVYGYNRIIKKCPYSFCRMFKCKGEKCQLYFVNNLVGDCSIIWNSVVAIKK